MRGPDSFERAGLSLFRRLPRGLRLFLVRWGAPRFTVGTTLVARNGAGEVLMVRQRHTGRWALPGGLLQRGEQPVDGVRREVHEEVGVELPDLAEPRVVVAPRARRVDIVFSCELDRTEPPSRGSPEVLDVQWFALDRLPDVTSPTMGALKAAGVA